MRIQFVNTMIPTFLKMDKKKLYAIIFQSNTKAGKLFDIYLIIAILFSVLLVILDSVPFIHQKMGITLQITEFIITILFTVEYILRIYCLNKPWKYIVSFYGIIDFLSILPTLLIFIIPGVQTLGIIRILRVLRIFRILQLNKFLTEAAFLINVLKHSFYKILIFMLFAFFSSILIGTIMYTFENQVNPAFSSIPKGIYWAIVTLTTVGYGDITPMTDIGQFLSAVVMILGYSIIAVPTGIFSAEFVKKYNIDSKNKSKECPHCKQTISSESEFCSYCGTKQNSDIISKKNI